MIKYAKTQEHCGHFQKRLLSWHDMVNHGPQNGPKTVFFSQRIVFTLSLGFVDDFGPKSYSKRPKTLFFWPEDLFERSLSCVGKGPNQRNTMYSSVVSEMCRSLGS